MAVVHGTDLSEIINQFDGVTGGADAIYGNKGHDWISGLGGNDVIIGGEDGDTMFGGSGSDTASYSDSDEGVTINLAIGFTSGGTAEGDTFHSIENLYGSWHDDTLIGDANANTLNGWGGNDELWGGGGADILIGGLGDDWAKYNGPSGVYVSLLTGIGQGGHAQGDTYSGIENVYGTGYDDILWGNDADNDLVGLGGSDEIRGFDGDDYLRGQQGDDELYGMDDDDQLGGDEGDDRLFGGAGDDNLVGNGGRDHLYGGADADTFTFISIDDTGVTELLADVIWDFNAAAGDKFWLPYIDADVYAAGDQDFTFIGDAAFTGTPGEIRYYHSGGSTYIQMQTGTSVDVEGVIRLDGIYTPEASWFVQ